MSDLTAHDVLTAAKSYLMRHGWVRVNYGDDGGPWCLVGAIQSACRSVNAPDGDLFYAARTAVYDVTGSSMPVFVWNDVPGRTFDEVIAALDRAIVATAPAETPVEEPVPA